MVDVLAFIASPIGGSTLELVPCLGLALLGLATTRPHRSEAAISSERRPVPRPATDNPWVAPTEP